jgi:hypothetical protein
MTRRRKIAGLTVFAVLAVSVLAACGPAPSAGPAGGCGSPAAHDAALESLQQQQYPYTIAADAQYGAQVSANRFCGATCPNGLPHATLASGWGENLYCKYYGTTTCPSPSQFAQDAISAWLNSSGHLANMQRFAGHYMGAGYTCWAGHAFGSIQFHY